MGSLLRRLPRDVLLLSISEWVSGEVRWVFNFMRGYRVGSRLVWGGFRVGVGLEWGGGVIEVLGCS